MEVSLLGITRFAQVQLFLTNQIMKAYISGVVRVSGVKLPYCLAAAGIVAFLASALTARAQTFSFLGIADSEGAFTGFGGAPVINNKGEVAFAASLDSGVRGIFFGRSPISDTIVDDTGPYDGFAFPAINNEGGVAFRAFVDSSEEHFLGGSGIFTGDDPETDAVAVHYVPNNPPDPWGSFGGPAINDEGTVVFPAITAFGGFGIYTGNDPATDTVADTLAASPFRNLSGPAINNKGTIVFFGELRAGGGGIFSGDDLPDDTIVTTAGPYSAFGAPAINDKDTVAFIANRDIGGRGIFTGPDSVSDAIATTDGEFSTFLNLSFNNNDAVAFGADLDSGDFGIYTGTAGQLRRVIGKGDALFESTVVTANLSAENLNDNGEIAFFYTLADGRSGVAVARPGSLDRQLEAGDDYDGVRLTSAVGADTSAVLRYGEAGVDRTVAMSFTSGGSFSIGGSLPVGDVLQLSGTGDDIFVLEMNYSEEDLVAAGDPGEVRLTIQWLDPADGMWKNAVFGNDPTGGQSFFGLSFDEYFSGSGVIALGAYGNDPDTNTVWAVLNHNSLFVIAIVPEPGVLSLTAFGGLICWFVRRGSRKRR